MPSAPPPYGRSILFACTMRSFRNRWLYTTCRCGSDASHPVRLMLTEHPKYATHTLADVLVRLSCRACKCRDRLTIWLAEDARGPGTYLPKFVRPGWLLLYKLELPNESSSGRVMATE